MQIGYVVKDVEKSVAEYSKRLGIGPWDIYTFCAPDFGMQSTGVNRSTINLS